MRRSIHLPLLHQGGFALDLDTGEVWRGDEPVPLSRLKARLHLYLAQNRCRPLPLDELLQAVWGIALGSGGTPDQAKRCVKRLREKIEADSARPQVVVTV